MHFKNQASVFVGVWYFNTKSYCSNFDPLNRMLNWMENNVKTLFGYEMDIKHKY